MSLVNSKNPEQQQRGVQLLERGEFLQPDSAKVKGPHVLAALHQAVEHALDG